MILAVMGLSTWVRSTWGWQYEATQLYMTMRALFTVSRLQGWSFCEPNEKRKNHWICVWEEGVCSTCHLRGSKAAPAARGQSLVTRPKEPQGQQKVLQLKASRVPETLIHLLIHSAYLY